MQLLPQPLFPHVAEHYEKEEGYTPRHIVEAVREVLGEIDLDPASCALANETVKARRYFSKEDNGLIQPWRGRVFLNPPFTRGKMPLFTQKLHDEVVAGHVIEACLLSGAITEARWFHLLAPVVSAYCFFQGRLSFLTPGEPLNPMKGQVISYLGPHVDRFAHVFAPLGLILVPHALGDS